MLICILASSLAFHVLTSERGTSTIIAILNKASVALNRLVSLFYLFCERGNRRTEPSTVTLAAHARRGLRLRMGVMLLRVGVSTCKARGGGIVVIVATLL